MPPQIRARALSRRYRVAVKGPGLLGALKHLWRPRFEDKIAVESLDLDIEAGERVAILGPNGAGKSTTVKMLTGVLSPTAGEVQVCGLVPHRERVRNARNISVIFGQRTQLWWDLPVAESLRLIADLYEVPPPRFRENLDACSAALGLEPLLSQPARTLSLGQRMRCDLAASLLHDPAVLFLDEPTIGLDLNVKERVRSLLRDRLRERGTTLLLTSHDLSDVEGLCERVLVIDGGKLVYDGRLDALDERFRRERVVRIALREEVPEAAARCGEALALPGLRVEQPDPRHLVLSFDPAVTSAATLLGAILPLLPAQDLRVEEPDLQAVLRQLYAGAVRGPS